jgi:hypothetical protein
VERGVSGGSRGGGGQDGAEGGARASRGDSRGDGGERKVRPLNEAQYRCTLNTLL